jgi:hypothetical protein
MFRSVLQQSWSAMAMTNTPQFGFATKSLKIIKTRMKAVLSIKKITKVFLQFKSGNEDGRRC